MISIYGILRQKIEEFEQSLRFPKYGQPQARSDARWENIARNGICHNYPFRTISIFEKLATKTGPPRYPCLRIVGDNNEKQHVGLGDY